MDCESLLSCSICNVVYNDRQIPRNLKCGHSLCSICLDYLIPISKTCPECRSEFTESKADEFPINHPILRMSRLFAYVNSDQVNYLPVALPIHFPGSELKKNAGQCPAHQGFTLFFHCTRCNVFVCRKCLVTDHQDPPMGFCSILPLGKTINDTSKSHIVTIDKYTEELSVVITSIESTSETLQLALKFFCNGNDDMKCHEELTKLKDDCAARWLQLDILITSMKEVKVKLSADKSPQEFLEVLKESRKMQLNFEKYMEKEREGEPSNLVNIILGNKKDLKEWVGEGKALYAVTEEGDEGEDKKFRWAPVGCKDDRILLYSLRDGTPPKEGIKIPHKILRDLVPTKSQSIFLEIGRGGEIKGRVFVDLFGDTPRSQQTLFLCSGEKGPSYRNTCFYAAITEAYGIHHICGGDYENNDGTGGRSIVEGIVNADHYKHIAQPGLFVSWPSVETWRLGNFDVYLNGEFPTQDYSAHGLVKEGLELLIEAAEITPVNETSVVDCGLVIPG